VFANRLVLRRIYRRSRPADHDHRA